MAETEYLNCGICAIYDGEKYYLGMGPSYEYPPCVVRRQLAGEEAGHMKDIFGEAKGRKGAIYTLSQERMYREEVEEMAVMMAITKIVSKEIYERK